MTARRRPVQTTSSSEPNGRFPWHALGVVALLAAYLSLSQVWTPWDLWLGLRAIVLVWLPLGLWLFTMLRDECSDGWEAAALSAAGSLALTTGLWFACDALALGWSPLRYGAIVVPGLCLITGGILLWQRYRKTPTGNVDFAARRQSWLLAAVMVASLCATARYQRAFEFTAEAGRSQYVLDGDQTYFVSLAQELNRRSPAATCPIRAGMPERAYHHLPHRTLALLASASGSDDVLRLNLTVGYSALIVTCVCLVYGIARRIGGNGAGLLAAWLLFLGAIPTGPWLANPFKFFFTTLWPPATSSIEPTLLTSPQMLYGMTVGLAVLLGLVLVHASDQQRRGATRIAVLLAAMTALTLRFRVQEFVVLAPLVGSYLLYRAVRLRQRSAWAPVATLAFVVLAQFVEMRLPVYLPVSQSLHFGNSEVGKIGFIQAWPGSATLAAWITTLFGDGAFGAWIWQFVSLTMFCLWNTLGLPILIGLGGLLRSEWRKPGKGVVWIVLGLFGLTLVTAALVSSEYDRYSIGGQIPLHLGWYLLPFAAVGFWRLMEPLTSRFSMSPATAALGFWLITLVAVEWQWIRTPSHAQQAVRARAFSVPSELSAAFQHCRDSLPESAVVLTNLQGTNMALWSGFGGRRAYLDYIPAGAALDPLLPAQDSVPSRIQVIQTIYASNSEAEVARLLAATGATHVVESTAKPIRVHPAALRRIWQSPQQSLVIWEFVP